MSENARATEVMQALHVFFSRFADAWAEGCVPDDAAYPLITYPPTLPAALETVPSYARVWHRSRQYGDIAALVDAIDAAIGPGLRLPTAHGGAVWLYKGDKFMQFAPVRDDPDLKCAYLSLSIASNA